MQSANKRLEHGPRDRSELWQRWHHHERIRLNVSFSGVIDAGGSPIEIWRHEIQETSLEGWRPMKRNRTYGVPELSAFHASSSGDPGSGNSFPPSMV